MNAFAVLSDPLRCRLVELLADREQSAGELTVRIQAEFGVSQPAVSRHLRILRETGFARARADGARRMYALDPAPLQEVDAWLDRYRRFWSQRLDALETELSRAAAGGRSEREE